MEAPPIPEIIETTLYRLDELSDDAKDNARASYRERCFDHDRYETVSGISSESRKSWASPSKLGSAASCWIAYLAGWKPRGELDFLV